MNSFSINPDIGIIANSTVKDRYQKLEKLIEEISHKKLSDNSVQLINKELGRLNATPLEASKLEKNLKHALHSIEDIVSSDSQSKSSPIKNMLKVLGIGAITYFITKRAQKSIEQKKQD